ncbi:MAG TPA: HPF/RaiA family ribosome-associated protein [Gammaproteobacteria bacterium]|nr:HPF/RaiA family ribosome-associated protein [Gammaproteobacteria bacterium]
MPIPSQIDFRGMETSDTLRKTIEQRVAKLERFSTQIIGCHVTIEQSERHHQKGNRYRMHVQVQVPGQDLYVSHDPARENQTAEDAYVVLRDTFDAVRRQLEEYERVRRGDVKHHEPTYRERKADQNPSQ